MSATLVAESLAVVPDLVRDALLPGERGTARGVAAAIARAALPPEAADPPPPWLLGEQEHAFRRAVHALREAGGALLATPVGSGKTFIALAAARAVRPADAVRVVAPAVLASQWRDVGSRLGIEVRVISHERVSRGDVPDGRGVVVVDESHRFRNRTTRRYRTLAPALVGRPVLLVSATPVVNRLDDLLHQLLLAVRDDALQPQGVASLRETLARPPAPPALSHLVIGGARDPGGRPARLEVVVDDWLAGDDAACEAVRALGRLRLSLDPGIAALIRTSLLRAAASSPAALLGSLERLALLLEHAHTARRAGRRVGRRDVERAVGALPDQLVLWGVLPNPDAPAELALTDRPRVQRLAARVRRAAAGPDRKLSLLRAFLADRRPTIVFTGSTATVHYLRRRLDVGDVAWVTGTRAGIGRLRYPRHIVLRLFDPLAGPEGLRPPWLLLASDVAAEGLNLQRVGRVVHYDLPWTDVRLGQRDGRAIRLGSAHAEVAVVRFDPPPEIESRLALLERITRKAALPREAGLGNAAAQTWVWHRRLEAAWRVEGAELGWAAVASGEAGGAVAVRIDGVGRSPILVALAQSPEGVWSDDPAMLGAVLEIARHAPPAPGGLEAIEAMLDSVTAAVKQRLRVANGLALRAATGPVRQAATRAAWRVLDSARRDRHMAGVHRADRALAVLRGGLTAGEEMLAALAADGDLRAMDRLAARPAAESPPGPPRIRLLAGLALVPSRGALPAAGPSD